MKKKEKQQRQQELELCKPADKVEVCSLQLGQLKDINYPLLASYVKSHILEKKLE